MASSHLYITNWVIFFSSCWPWAQSNLFGPWLIALWNFKLLHTKTSFLAWNWRHLLCIDRKLTTLVLLVKVVKGKGHWGSRKRYNIKSLLGLFDNTCNYTLFHTQQAKLWRLKQLFALSTIEKQNCACEITARNLIVLCNLAQGWLDTLQSQYMKQLSRRWCCTC